MRKITALVRRELAAYFVSPIAYVMLGVFLILVGRDFGYNPEYFFEDGGVFAYGSVLSLLKQMSLMILFVVPLLTMRLLSEEVNSGTFELLMTAPVSNTAVVVAKFLGAFCFFIVMLLPTLAFPVTLYIISGSAPPDVGPMVSGYFGLLLLGMTAIAVGVFVSACVRNQISAALGTGLIFALSWWAGDVTARQAVTWRAHATQYLAMLYHYESFPKGLIDTSDVVFFVSATALFLFGAIGVLAVRRWR